MPDEETRKPRGAKVRSKGLIGGTLDVNAALAFIFGVIFISVMLGFAYKVPNPSPFAQWVFTVVVALAGAGVGAVIPGILKITLPYARAGGALAIFAAIFLLKPAILDTVIQLETPNESPMPAIDAFLAKVDAKDTDGAWASLDDAAKQSIAKDRELYRMAYENGRYPLGDVISRTPFGGALVTSPSGSPIGVYRGVNFKTKFSSGQCYQEVVTVRAATDLRWRVFGHSIDPRPISC